MSSIRDLAVGEVLVAPSPSLSGISLTLKAGQGEDMPTTRPFKLLVFPSGQIPTRHNSEKVIVTDRSGDVLTITRAQSPTIAQPIAVGWLVSNAIFTEDLFTSSIVIGETLGGTPNGTLKAFTTASPFSAISVYKNGIRLRSGASNDYTTSGNTITFATAPATDAVLVADYMVGSQVMVNGSNSFISKENAVGTPNGSLTTFSVSRGSYIGGSLQVFVNGLRQGLAHVTETSPSAGTFTLDSAPSTGDIVDVAYQFASSVTANADTVDGIHASTIPTANSLLPLSSTGIAQVPVHLQLNTTNSTPNCIIQTGHGFVSVGSGSDAAKTVTFPVAFTSKPVVICQFEGYFAGGTFQSTPTADWGGMTFSAQNQTATSFVARGRRNDGATLNGDYYYSWIAIGA